MEEQIDQPIAKSTLVTYDEFKKMDIRVGTIKSLEPIEGTDKLLKCMVDVGPASPSDSGRDPELRQIISGIREYYPEFEKLVGKQVLYIINLEPRTIRGFESQGMLMAVDGKEGGPVFLIPEVEVIPGSKVR